MKPRTLLSIAVWLALTGSRACAQTAPTPTPRPTPPPPPFLNTTPEFSAWTITRNVVQGLGSQSMEEVARHASEATRPDSLTNVTKTGPIRHQTRKLKTGQLEDIWYEHGNRTTMESDWKIPMFEIATSGAKQPQGPDFPELSWISAPNFVGTQAFQSATYFVFESQLNEGDAVAAKEYGNKIVTVFNRVYINADTRLPWLHQTGDVLQRYDFQTAPSAMLEVPPEYQAIFDTYEKKKAAARRPAAP